MKFAIGLFALCVAFAGPAAAAEVYPVEFGHGGDGANVSIMFVDQVFEADETWLVTGTCEKDRGATRVVVVNSVFAAHITVKLVSKANRADRAVCVTNPHDAPQELKATLDS